MSEILEVASTIGSAEAERYYMIHLKNRGRNRIPFRRIKIIDRTLAAQETTTTGRVSTNIMSSKKVGTQPVAISLQQAQVIGVQDRFRSSGQTTFRENCWVHVWRLRGAAVKARAVD